MKLVGYQGEVDKLIPEEFITSDIRATKEYKEYEKVFFGKRKRKHIAGETSSPKPSLRIRVKQFKTSKLVYLVIQVDDDDDSGNRIEPRSHKKHPKIVDDDDDNEKEKKDNDNDDDAIHKNVDNILHDVIPKIASNATNDIIENNLTNLLVKEVISLTSTIFEDEKRIDTFRGSDHDDHQEDDAPPEVEKRPKRRKSSRNEVIPEDESPELIVDDHVPTIYDHKRMEATLKDMMSNLFRNVEEFAYHLEQSKNYMEKQIHGNSEEKTYVLSLHKIHAISFPEDDLEERMNRWVKKEFKTFNEEARLSIQQWKDSWHKRLNKINHRRVRANSEEYFSIHKFIEVVRVTTEQQHGLDF
ncbi:hypothetical protein Tco_1317492 [Tanacetum coccineum]